MLPVTTGLRILGLSGGTMPTRPLPDARSEDRIPTPVDAYHDAAAVLVGDGAVLAGVEEERLNRLKHTNKLPVRAIRACLQIAGLTLDDVTRFAYYGREDLHDKMIATYMAQHPHLTPHWTMRAYLADALSEDLGADIDPARLAFVEHHLAHATSAYDLGPFREALVVTLDGHGDNLSGTVWAGRAGELTRLHDIPERDSLGFFYLYATRYLGYSLFDEYKVMGLAPYGNPARFRKLCETIYALEPDGHFTIKLPEMTRALSTLPPPRRSGEPIIALHRDIAAAVQETVERAAMHLLSHYRRETGLRHLCLAGGVAHNSTMNGKIARSGLFDGIYVQPASHDAGCALGAALRVHRELAPGVAVKRPAHVYWGPSPGDGSAVRAQLDAWSPFVEARCVADVADETAQLLAAGAVVGWVQGRSEFGPRALGNRSILADPRPAANRDRINELVKQRESYRPFAPAVIEEAADDFFEMPPGTDTSCMTLTVPVREHMRATLAAITHVDGTARVQTVSRGDNPRFWALLNAFRARTGVPVLLNTSFNHSVEPIVESIDDAVTCFLTTGLSHLVVDQYIVTKRDGVRERVWSLVPVIPEHVRVTHARQVDARGEIEDMFWCQHTVMPSRSKTLSRATHGLLQRADGHRALDELIERPLSIGDRAAVAAELEELWAQRLLRFLPAAATVAATRARAC